METITIVAPNSRACVGDDRCNSIWSTQCCGGWARRPRNAQSALIRQPHGVMAWGLSRKVVPTTQRFVNVMLEGKKHNSLAASELRLRTSFLFRLL